MQNPPSSSSSEEPTSTTPVPFDISSSSLAKAIKEGTLLEKEKVKKEDVVSLLRFLKVIKDECFKKGESVSTRVFQTCGFIFTSYFSNPKMGRSGSPLIVGRVYLGFGDLSRCATKTIPEKLKVEFPGFTEDSPKKQELVNKRQKLNSSGPCPVKRVYSRPIELEPGMIFISVEKLQLTEETKEENPIYLLYVVQSRKGSQRVLTTEPLWPHLRTGFYVPIPQALQVQQLPHLYLDPPGGMEGVAVVLTLMAPCPDPTKVFVKWDDQFLEVAVFPVSSNRWMCCAPRMPNGHSSSVCLYWGREPISIVAKFAYPTEAVVMDHIIRVEVNDISE